MERETIGKLSTDLLQRDVYADHSAGEQMQEQLSDYESNIHECISRGKNMFATDFFVNVHTKREKLMPNVFRNYFFPTLACPTPTWDQIVYKYTRKDDSIELLWVVPDRVSCGQISNDRFNLHFSQKELLQFVLDFNDGTLDRKAKIINGEPVILPS